MTFRCTRTFFLWLGLSMIFGCAEPLPTEADIAVIDQQADHLAQTLAGEKLAQTSPVVVRLMFDSDVDLDLYVTDPLLDTVYFARHETRMGGVLSRDVRCETKGARVEEVRFETLWPGKYRVGVDFPRRCDERDVTDPAPYAVEVVADGQTHRVHGLVNLEYFEVEVLAFEVAEGES
ncbi:MAG: hypothetical protein ACI96M_002432 [Candidatus Azotimanducaceae bacterium]|jgi:hypothetical protein